MPFPRTPTTTTSAATTTPNATPNEPYHIRSDANRLGYTVRFDLIQAA